MKRRYEIVKQFLDEKNIIILEIEEKSTIKWTIGELKMKKSATFIFEESFQRTMEWMLQNHPELLL